MESELIGKQSEPVTMRVEFGKIREFARAIKDDNAIYFDEEVGRREAGGVMPPPTFSMTQAFWDSSEGSLMRKLNFDLRRVLHGGQEFEYVKPIYAGDVLTATARIAEVFKKPGKRGGEMTFAVLETEYKNQKAEVVLYARSTVIETAKPVERKD